MNRQTQLLTSKPYSITSLGQLAGSLRRAVTARLMREFGAQLTPPLIRRVLDEASELAQETGFPNLFFPALAEEKARFVSTALGDRHFDQPAREQFSHAA